MSETNNNPLIRRLEIPDPAPSANLLEGADDLGRLDGVQFYGVSLVVALEDAGGVTIVTTRGRWPVTPQAQAVAALRGQDELRQQLEQQRATMKHVVMHGLENFPDGTRVPCPYPDCPVDAGVGRQLNSHFYGAHKVRLSAWRAQQRGEQNAPSTEHDADAEDG